MRTRISDPKGGNMQNLAACLFQGEPQTVSARVHSPWVLGWPGSGCTPHEKAVLGAWSWGKVMGGCMVVWCSGDPHFLL